MSKTRKYRNTYDHDKLPGLDCSTDPSRTKQEFLDEVNINDIVNRHQERGLAPRVNDRPPKYGDFSHPDLQDYARAIDKVRGVGELMQQLSANVRARFANDPVNVLLFVQDPRNRQEAIDLGLIEPGLQAPGENAPKGTPQNPPQTPKATP